MQDLDPRPHLRATFYMAEHSGVPPSQTSQPSQASFGGLHNRIGAELLATFSMATPMAQVILITCCYINLSVFVGANPSGWKYFYLLNSSNAFPAKEVSNT